MKRKIKRKWRHLKYWLVRKMFPDNELNFLVVPEHADIQITAITANVGMPKHLYDFLREDERREKVLKQMRINIANHMVMTETWQEDMCTLTGTIYIAKERE